MKTLHMLRTGKLAGETVFSLSCGLKTFPVEIFDLSDTLEVLNLSGNQLSSLPDDFGRFKKLRILFLSQNEFTEIPEVLAQCPELTMIGFKSNQISQFSENALPPKIQWLILTDNQIVQLPNSLGELKHLQKCMLAGNRLTSLPDSMVACQSLELLRLSANQLESIPSWLFTLPRLSWLACAGNPCTRNHLLEQESLTQITWDDLLLHENLGEGASGIISRGSWLSKQKSIAVKIFKGEVTSDGYPADEMQVCMAVGEHSNLTTVHGKLHAHPQEKEGLVLSLIPPSYSNLGNPPDFETCTRDTYEEGSSFSLSFLIRIAMGITSASVHLHGKGIMHGDLYAHNILVDESGHGLLGDFGAATLYNNSKGISCGSFERLEVRAFACLLEDMLDRCRDENLSSYETIVKELYLLKDLCMDKSVVHRPLFTDIYTTLAKIENQLKS